MRNAGTLSLTTRVGLLTSSPQVTSDVRSRCALYVRSFYERLLRA